MIELQTAVVRGRVRVKCDRVRAADGRAAARLRDDPALGASQPLEGIAAVPIGVANAGKFNEAELLNIEVGAAVVQPDRDRVDLPDVLRHDEL